jgi:hypothetical protein
VGSIKYKQGLGLLGKKQDPISKITREKRAERHSSTAEHLPSKCKALSSNLVLPKKK